MHDPILTAYGEEQCHTLARHFPHHNNVELLVASPLRRTIYTTLLGFEPQIKKGLMIIALPELQEVSDYRSDTGSDVEVLQKEMQGKPVDLSLVPEGWNSKKGKWSPDSEAVEKRAKEARQWLKARPEREIVVTSHGGFLHFFTEDWSDDPARTQGTGWENTEFRSYRFSEESGDSVSIVETTESRERRRGTEKPLTETEQNQLKETTHKSWENSGHQIQAKV